MRGVVVLVLCGLVLAAGGCLGALDTQESHADATVVSVVDGDTLDVRFSDGSTDTVRLLGVDTPEVHVPVRPAEFDVPNTTAGRACLRAVGENASAFATEFVGNRPVRLAFDPMADRRGGYGRLLAYVQRGDADLNYRLVRDGFARVYETEFSRLERYREAASAAQAEGRGVWRCGT